MSYYYKKGYYSKEASSKIKTTINELKGVPVEGCFSGDGSTTVLSGADKIREDLINLFSINEGEVFFNPTLGSNLFDCLFETNDFLLRDTLRYKVKEAVEKHMPQIKILSVDITQYYDSLRVAIQVNYLITTLGIEDKLVLYKDIREKFGGD